MMRMLKKIAIITVFLGLVSFIGAHGSEEKGHEKDKRKFLDDKSKVSVVRMLETNEKLHAAFFEYDAKKVEENALALKKAIDAIETPEIVKLLKFAKSKLDEIKANNEREGNNQNYHIVSSALIYIVNTFDVGPKYNAYSCPMIKKKWVQNTQKMAKVHNPYAPEMPHCGTQDSHHK